MSICAGCWSGAAAPVAEVRWRRREGGLRSEGKTEVKSSHDGFLFIYLFIVLMFFCKWLQEGLCFVNCGLWIAEYLFFVSSDEQRTLRSMVS